MSKRIYIKHLSSKISEQEVRSLCSKFGRVSSVRLVSDRVIGRHGGSAYVEMETGADEAIRTLNRRQMDGKSLNVNEA